MPSSFFWRTPRGVGPVDPLPAPGSAEDPAKTASRIPAAFAPEGPRAFALWLPVPEDSGLDVRVQALLPPAAAERLARVASPERRRLRLWSRAAALLFLKALCAGHPTLAYREDPPFGPVLSDDCGTAFFVTLAHTRNAAAAVLSRTPAGIDIEARRTLKNPEAVLAWTFGQEAARAACRSPDVEKHFFALWGLRECVVKMNRARAGEEPRFGLEFGKERENRWRVRVTGGALEPAAMLFALPQGWLTVLTPTGRSVPLAALNPEGLAGFLEGSGA